MSRTVSVLRLLLLVPIAYAAACFVGAVIVMLAMKDLVAFFGSVFFVVVPFLGAWIIFVLLLPPMAVAVVLAEKRAWRSVVYWVVAGVLLAFLPFVPGFGLYADFLGTLHIVPTKLGSVGERVTLTPSVIAIVMIAGIAAGLTYWSMAGRYSGGGDSG